MVDVNHSGTARTVLAIYPRGCTDTLPPTLHQRSTTTPRPGGLLVCSTGERKSSGWSEGALTRIARYFRVAVTIASVACELSSVE